MLLSSIGMAIRARMSLNQNTVSPLRIRFISPSLTSKTRSGAFDANEARPRVKILYTSLIANCFFTPFLPTALAGRLSVISGDEI